MMLAYQAYKGPANIPHVSGDMFGAFFLATHVCHHQNPCIITDVTASTISPC